MAGLDHLVRFADFLEREDCGDFWLYLPGINQLGDLSQCLSNWGC